MELTVNLVYYRISVELVNWCHATKTAIHVILNQLSITQ